MDQFNDVLVVMAKAPVPGTVKTRLAATLGPDRACKLYCAFLRDIAQRLGTGPHALCWAVHPPDTRLDGVLGTAFPHLAQRGTDLAARMHNVFVDLFGGGAQRVVMLGADAPHVSGEDVARAFAVLDQSDVVVMPTRDGGYCLIGLRAGYDLFTGVPMGSDQVVAATRARAAALRLRVSTLPTTFDVDEPGDVRALRQWLEGNRTALPHTRAVLGTWGWLDG